MDVVNCWDASLTYREGDKVIHMDGYAYELKKVFDERGNCILAFVRIPMEE